MYPPKKPTRVMVAMSGGVDSTAAAFFLKEAGFDIKGVHMSLWQHPPNENQPNRDLLAARFAAESMAIDFEVVDLKHYFHEMVVGDYLSALGAGLTPNPCVICNRVIKWGVLMEYAQSQGFDYLASGHYARLISEDNGRVRLLKGVDQNKDQSYVVSTLDQRTLSHMLLPLGDKTKVEVKRIVDGTGLRFESRRESQDLCFLNGLSQENFLDQYAPEMKQSGEIVNLQGKILGKHMGLAFYTIGQRKGLGIAAPEPLYVIKKDVPTNRLVVGNDGDLPMFGLKAKLANWISGIPPDINKEYTFKIRYSANIVPGKIIDLIGSEFSVKFHGGLRDITPGQYVAVYDNDVCLGGGEITGSIP